ncbi:MFS transporter [Actinokineospora globicatena]|uniref:MFS transporter n=1 Tax=Actinokineospora globicatena TaxID=103729 RepID=UPI0020A371CB|nr:MFS transporter [Actinokineospora globicatena]MCP2301614.1 putative arabinose efflux permease, MFS family [Actinokineospora globicatena]GLW76732.1 MFS transporter [Actinokineospora globicatena]GLW83565.1 MFS transporter [Actinokineospora globicatena]
MYVASTRQTKASPSDGGARPSRVPTTVVLLGTVSLLTDISSEMVTAFLPIYVIFNLQMSYLQLGLLDGIYTGATAVLRLVGGHISDRVHRHKAVAIAGYGMSAATKLLFPAIGASSVGLGGVLAIDRAGKGLRTAPRDALISLVTPKEKLGESFGVHRTMDTIGALLGPLATFALLTWVTTRPNPIFMISFCFAALGVIVLIFFVRQPRLERVPGKVVTLRATADLLRNKGMRRTTIAAGLLGLATISDAFVFVVLQKVSGVSPTWLALMPVGTALTFLLAATPLGRLADRLGRWRVFFAGHVVLLAVYLLLLGPFTGIVLVVITVGLHGLFYAATDGVLMAHGATLVPEHLRASGLSIVQTGQALARFASSIAVGLLLQNLAFSTAVLISISTMVIALVGVFLLIRPEVSR